MREGGRYHRLFIVGCIAYHTQLKSERTDSISLGEAFKKNYVPTCLETENLELFKCILHCVSLYLRTYVFFCLVLIFSCTIRDIIVLKNKRDTQVLVGIR